MRDSLLYKRGALSACHLERQKMAFGVRLCLCLLLVFAVISSARNTISFSDNELALAVKGRSLKMTLNDYGEPMANRGHDPSQRNKNRGGRKG
ncbi:protein PSY3 [Populus trichocarpa]|nr:protein PSY3 [Populus trichocarpa]|eukprot:XP_024463733.1 protein PSY3 [Populus trichocarpa]